METQLKIKFYYQTNINLPIESISYCCNSLIFNIMSSVKPLDNRNPFLCNANCF